MPFEHYKTQVLLLHSQQTTLDKLCSGFNDQYSVHCATSGTEALNTLGDTPIHVIVSAQDLPGMSGLDALREAKKRSPDTIAILLAGTDAGDGLEAMVGDKEVFQIVRGEISPDALKNLIDSATKSVRLLALSEASNDTAANVDEPYSTGEHIVMETAANGSVIISDGTGSVPILDPNSINASTNANRQSVDVLVLTKDEEFLNTVKESSRGLHNVHHAVTPQQAEGMVSEHPVGILVTDAAMVGSNIEVLTQRLRAHSPRIVAIVAGRRDDGELLMDLINRGHVYRFLLKPVSPGRARLAIEASVKHHLEAAESAFKGKPKATPGKPQAKAPATKPAAAKPAARPAAAAQRTQPAQPAQPAAAPAPTSKKARKKNKQTVADIAAANKRRNAAQSTGTHATDPGSTAATKTAVRPSSAPGLDDAFDEPNSFTETMTGIAISVGKSISDAAGSFKAKQENKKKKKKEKEKEKNQPATPVAEPKVASMSSPQGAAPIRPPQPSPAPQAAASPQPQPQPQPKPVVQPLKSVGKAEPDKPPAAPAAPRPAATTVTDIAPKAAAAGMRAEPTLRAEPMAGRAPRDNDGGSLLGNPKVIALIAGVVLFSVLSLWMFSGDDEIPVAPASEPGITQSPPSTDTEPAPAAAIETDRGPANLNASAVDDLLRRADDARAQGSLYAPAGQNAVEFLLQARDTDPGNTQVAAELERSIAEVFGLAEAALLDNRSIDASRALRVIGLAEPENPRLAFLNAQLSQQQLRAYLDDARLAIRENRFEDAGRLLAQAETTAGGSNAEIESLSAELASTRSSQQIDDVLSLAAQRLTDDQLISPPNDNARYYYELALSNAPNNLAAQQGLVAVASKLVLRARGAVDAGNYDAAEGLLADARGLDPSSSELAAAAAALDNARNQQTAQDRVAAEQQREAERLAAERAAMTAREAEANRLAAEREAERQAELERQAAAEAEARRVAAASPPVAAASAAEVEDAAATRSDEPVAISALERTTYVPPKYPRLAQRRNASGFVDLAFTVGTDGKVSAVDVTNSEPGTMFDEAAIEAVQQWEFAPPEENGTPVEKRVAVRMTFALQ